MIKEFKEFISRGNVVDLAVGVIVGGAFSNIVNSLVNDILMPIIGVLIGGRDFSGLSIKIGDANICYGSFIQNIVNFLIIALCIFFFVKAINKISKMSLNDLKKIKDIKNLGKKSSKEEIKEEVKEESVKEEKETTISKEEIELLTEIRDLLKKEKKSK